MEHSNKAATGPTAPEARGAHSSFFRKIDWSAFWTATVISFAVYCYTLAPTVTLEDSGELAVAGDHLGVPHPPGYPIWTLMAWIFARVFSFVPYLGQPNPAWSIGLLSAVCGSLAAGVTAMLISRSGSHILRDSEHFSSRTGKSMENIICWVAGVSASLIFAFTPAMWSQSVIAEVYGLNALFLALIFLFVYMWMRVQDDKYLFLTAIVFGLGLTNYQALLFAALVLVAAVMVKDLCLFRDFCITGAPFGMILLAVKAGLLPPIPPPSNPVFFVYAAVNFLILSIAFFFLPRGKTVAVAFFLSELGVAFYGFMPIVSDLRNPPMNWAYPRTWEGFLHALTRGQYEKIKPTDVFSMRFVHQLGFYLSDLRRQFYLPVALLGFLPFTIWRIRIRRFNFSAVHAAFGLWALITLIWLLEVIFFAGQGADTVYKSLTAGIIALMLAGAASLLINQGVEYADTLLGRNPSAGISDKIISGFILSGVVVLYLYYVVMLTGNMIDMTEPLRSAGKSLTGEQVRILLMRSVGTAGLILAPPLFVWLVYRLMHSRFELKVTVGTTSQKWIIATLFGFLAMGILFITLANLKMTIQDTFIQRVKFISSHALYAFWIGYGLVFLLSYICDLRLPAPMMKHLSLALAFALPLAPILKNAYDREIRKVYGGAEQRGHDYGWQFGNYQLRGAEAVSEELNTENEPLPNPEYPPPMELDAIFYGGTDPGRFVPTYMIYSARVREDVYLITQNALADKTYLNVMRDLYGDRIWIAAPPDSAEAFREYVQSRRRAGDNSVTFADGRVQVSGAAQVMEINGIIARKMFEHNKHKHAFYIEESYVIRWMHPYLEPHGLIMKINPEPINLTRRMVRNDMEFWDWYTRCLTADIEFLRDITARKSFSKLRGAIAGLYSHKGKPRMSEQAYHEALLIYPLSPEANLRLAQEVYMVQHRFQDARNVVEEFLYHDPNNTGAKQFLGHLDRLEETFSEIRRLESVKNSSGKIEVHQALKLAQLYLSVGNNSAFMQLITGIVNNPTLPPQYHLNAAQLLHRAGRRNDAAKALDRCIDRMPEQAPPEVFLQMAKIYIEGGKPAGAVKALGRYHELKPSDWRAALDLTAIQLSLGNTNSARKTLQDAMYYGGSEVARIVSRDPRFAALRQTAGRRTRNLLRIPGRREPSPALPFP
ncbi:MAG: DUF2723 domain-containing protein [Kiritimatiellia bacterium]